MTESGNTLVGGGLLRLLADTFILVYKVRHLCWRTNGPLGSKFTAIFNAEYGALNATSDDIARKIVAAGGEVPHSPDALAAMSSVKPGPTSPNPVASLAAIARDHETILADIDTLEAMVSADADDETRDLLVRLATQHRASKDELERITAG